MAGFHIWKLPRADDLLPPELLAEVQKYVQERAIYVPKVRVGLKAKTAEKHLRICMLRQSGKTVAQISKIMKTSERHIYTVLAEDRKRAEALFSIDE